MKALKSSTRFVFMRVSFSASFYCSTFTRSPPRKAFNSSECSGFSILSRLPRADLEWNSRRVFFIVIIIIIIAPLLTFFLFSLSLSLFITQSRNPRRARTATAKRIKRRTTERRTSGTSRCRANTKTCRRKCSCRSKRISLKARDLITTNS